MSEPQVSSSVTSTNYVLGYDWGKVEAFVHDNSITIHCLPRDPPGRLYEARISRPDGELYRERSFIPPPGYEVGSSARAPDCENPAELRPSILTMLDRLPADIADVITTAFSDD